MIGRETDAPEQHSDAFTPLAGGSDAVDCQRLRDCGADRHARVERGIGVLKNHLRLAAHWLHFAEVKPAISTPSMTTWPEKGMRPSTAFPIVDLPEPLSPTRPSVRPG